MKCPFCGHADDRVLDTRVQKDGSIRRRRECLECKARFSTVETIMLAFPFIIKKRRPPRTVQQRKNPQRSSGLLSKASGQSGADRCGG
ncbi:hypothetical protein [Bdellovibrio bacteriovorus]|uniref:NrdR family transcriptional regulator n=1 Tax=Bdellovibrio bacteriovorus TaxID=959 RepID=UPI0035A63506